MTYIPWKGLLLGEIFQNLSSFFIRPDLIRSRGAMFVLGTWNQGNRNPGASVVAVFFVDFIGCYSISFLLIVILAYWGAFEVIEYTFKVGIKH